MHFPIVGVNLIRKQELFVNNLNFMHMWTKDDIYNDQR